jgi:A/G-specific adenine glycosylase
MDVPKLRRELLRWYQASRRDLPWRRTRDPWAILVSELMLQQTQVKTALPYYVRFLERFPDAAALARAPEEQVLAAWAGLGYYRRARFLQAAARAVGAGGGFPQTLDGIRALPGVGAYTAAAVGSIAFGLPEAVVDGNVVRVLSRLLALEDDPTRGTGALRIRATAQELLDPRHPGDFNQAVMELGASLCSPAAPRCGDCPLSRHCAAFLAGRPADFPRLPARPASRTLVKAVLLVLRGRGARARILARARGAEPAPAKGRPRGQAADRLQGFWAFPEIELDAEDWNLAASKGLRLARKIAGAGVVPAGRLAKLRHRITVYDIHLLPLRFGAAAESAESGGSAAAAGWEWVTPTRLASLPLASAEKKLLALLQAGLGPDHGAGDQLGLKL